MLLIDAMCNRNPALMGCKDRRDNKMGGACKNINPKPIATMKGKGAPILELEASISTNFKLLKKLVFLNNNYVHYIKLPYREVRITDILVPANNLMYFAVKEKDITSQLSQVQKLILDSIAGISPSQASMKEMNTMWSHLTQSAGLQTDKSMDTVI